MQLVSTVLIVASNLIVGQLIEHTKALAGKARPWILLSALTLSVASVQTAISVSYIWVETVCYIIGAVILILFWTVEKNLPEEQKAIKERSKK